MNPNTKKLITIGGLVFVSLFIWLIYALTPKTYIQLQIAPSSADLSIDSKEYGTVSYNQKIVVSPGEHTIQLSRAEFSTETTTVSVEKNETKTVLLALTPQTDEAWSILRSDPTSVSIFEGFGAKKSTDIAKKIETKNPLYEKLPINTREYYIYLCPSLKDFTNELKRAICVDMVDDQVLSNALLALDNAGFDRSKEEIYASTDSNIRPIITNSDYTVSYYRGLNANNKPTFAIIIKSPTIGESRTSELIALKDKALAEFTALGFPLDKSNIVFVNHELEAYNTSPDVIFPGAAH